MASSRPMEELEPKHSSNSTVNFSPPLTTNALLACLVACLGCMVSGCVLAYPSPAVPDINSHRNPFHLDEEEQSWVGSIFNLGSVIGALVSGYISDLLGRKLSIMVATLPAVVGWAIITASPNVTILCLGRVVTGLSRGLLVGMCHIYIAEIAPFNVRGTLLASASVASVLGNLYEYCLGYFLSWNWLAIASAVIPLCLICLMYHMPESPRYLVLCSHTEEAEDTLLWLRQNSECVAREMEEIKRAIVVNRNAISWNEFLKKPLLKPLIITLGVFTAQQFSGTNIIRIYTVTIFDQTETALDSNVQTIVLGLVGVAGTLLALILLDHIGRKMSLILSNVLMTVCLSAAGAYFKVLEMDETYASTYLSWLPLVSLVFNNFSYAIAYDPVPWVIASELFPTRARGLANSLAGFWQAICSFVVSKLFVNIAVKTYWIFWICAAISVASGICISLFLPETKGKSLEQIEEKLQG